MHGCLKKSFQVSAHPRWTELLRPVYSAYREETDVDQIGVGGAGVFEDFYKIQL